MDSHAFANLKPARQPRPSLSLGLAGLTLSLAMILLCAPAPSHAATALVRQERLVHRFDFEETDDQGRKLGHGYQWPRHWYGIGRPADTDDPHFQRQPLHQELIERRGYPRYTDIRYDDRHATSGDFSFHLGLDGGNAGAYLEVGTLPAIPGSDYLITANVRTRNLDRARAQIRVYFIDDQGRRVPGSTQTTTPLRTQDEWTTVAVKLGGGSTEAAWIGMELTVHQPGPAPDHPLNEQQIVLQDVTGQAWFDDISVWQVPHVELRTASATNIVTTDDPPRLEARVRDLSGRRLIATLRVHDHRGELIDEQRVEVGQGAPMRWPWTPDLKQFGWYLLDLTVRDTADDGSADRPVARTFGAMLWMPTHPRLAREDRERFALRAEGVPTRQWPLLPEILRQTRIERAVVSAWQRDTTTRNIEQRVDELDRLLYDLDAAHARLTLSLHPVPQELSEHDGGNVRRPLEALAGPVESWRRYLLPILMRHSQRVREWQLGNPRSAMGLFDRRLEERLSYIHGHLREMAPRPQLLLPWRLDQARRPGLDAFEPADRLTMSLDVPPGIVPRRIPDHLQAWRDVPHPYRLSLRTLPADRLAHQRRVTDLALRMIHSWRAQPAALEMPQPWTAAAENRPAVLPDPLLGVFTQVAHQLAGRRIVGKLPIGEGLHCYILDGPAGGALVAWNEQASDETAQIEIYLGEAPVVRDVWGNAQTVPLESGIHRVRLGRTPVFITGIDPELARFRASFKVEPALIESRQVPHNRTITLTNPWSRTISGQLRFLGPEGWQHQPTMHTFSIAAGDELQLPVRLRFPIAEVAGPKTLNARFEFTAEQQYDVEIAAPMSLGLPGIGFDATVALEAGQSPGTQDALIACVITNRGDEETALYVFANLVGHPRQERLISRLEPGQSVVRRFRFQNVGDEIRDNPIRTGVRETDGPAILNKRLSPTDLP